jgi:hypothetical protein
MIFFFVSLCDGSKFDTRINILDTKGKTSKTIFGKILWGERCDLNPSMNHEHLEFPLDFISISRTSNFYLLGNESCFQKIILKSKD